MTDNKNMTEFGMRIARYGIIKQINKGCCQKNLVISPLSLHIALNMVASTSTGRTLKQFLRFLELESITDLNARSSLFMELATTGKGGPILSLVNGIWLNHRFPVKPSFKQLAKDIYNAKAESVDFTNQTEQVTDEINSWAREASKGHIDPLLRPNFFEKNAIALLASAIYFNGTWVQKFRAEDTKDEIFHLPNGEKVRVLFMKINRGKHLYGSFEGFKLLKMEYKNDESDKKKYAMYIYLPHKKDGLPELKEKLVSDSRFLLENREVKLADLENLWLPKLKYESDFNVLETMKELGLDLPFDENKAEITEMVEVSEVVYISKAFQKSYIEVNEEGTTGVTMFSFAPGSAPPRRVPPSPKPSFIADHPFLFMIIEEVSDIILFVGAALNPVSENATEKKRKMGATNNEEPKDGKKGRMLFDEFNF